MADKKYHLHLGNNNKTYTASAKVNASSSLNKSLTPEPFVSMEEEVSSILNELDSLDPEHTRNKKTASEPADSIQKAGNYINISISGDALKASFSLIKPDKKLVFSLEDILASLKESGVRFGIQKEAIEASLKNISFNRPYPAAEGKHPIDGVNGSFEFLFQSGTQKKPRILSDGSVDYSSYDDITVVKCGDELVHYIPATNGSAGLSVTGTVIPSKKGNDLPVLKGKGFYTSEDNLIYYAAIDGRPEYRDGHLTVTNLLEIETDVTHTTGNVSFAGDIHIKGNVYTGTVIHSNGSISVDGHVEGAHLIAAHDIILKGGMQGSGKGMIEAGGTVQGKFFEQVTINCRQDLTANSILNCHIRCYGAIQVNGRLGIIVGGSVFALKEIHATMIGNMAEVKTDISVGIDATLHRENLLREKTYSMALEELSKIESGIRQLSGLISKTNRPDLKEKKMLLFRAKVSKGSEIKAIEEKKAEYETLSHTTENSQVIVSKSIYPRVTISINGITTTLQSQNYNITYKLVDGDISSIPNI